MPLTRDFKETIAAQVRSDAAFRDALLREAIECLLRGEFQTGTVVLRALLQA